MKGRKLNIGQGEMNESDIDNIIAKAASKIHINPIISIFKSPKWEEAAELYCKAANLCKRSGKLDQAGNMYMKAAKCYEEENLKFYEKNSYVKAFHCYKEINSNLAIKCMDKVIECELDEGKFVDAANQYKILAEFYLSQAEMIKASEAYEQAAKLYKEEGQIATAINCNIEVGRLLAIRKDYHKSAKIFDEVSLGCLKNKYLKYSGPIHHQNAIFCYLANHDYVGAERAAEKYKEEDYTFNDDKNSQIIEDLINSCMNFDDDLFKSAISQLDQQKRFQPWVLDILLDIKLKLELEIDNDELC